MPGKREPPAWFGSLIGGNRDQSGLRYRRNRYYDPATGQFTQQDPIGLAGGLNLYGFANGDPVNFSDPFGLQACDPPDDPECKKKAEATESSEATRADEPEDSRTPLQVVGDFTAGFGDFITFGGTKKVRELWDCGDCVDYESGVYTAGQVTGGVTAVAGGALGVARAAGVTSRVAIHGAHHTFPLVGRAAHIQVNVWRIGVPGSGRALRIPLPWR